METTLHVFKYSLPLTIYDAVVLHANKFLRTSGGAFNLPVETTLYYNVVFRIKELGEDFPLCIREGASILYPGR
jgi:hypothetical protein